MMRSEATASAEPTTVIEREAQVPKAVGNAVRVALYDLDIGHVAAEAVSHDLRVGRGVGLAVVVAAAEHGDLAAGVDPDGGDVPEPHAAAEGGGQPARPGAAGTDEGRHADPHQHAVRPEPRLLGPERVEIGERASPVEHRREVAHVVGDAGRARIRHGGGRHEVARAGLDRIAGHLPRAILDQALDDVGDLGIAGAAIGVDRRGVGVGAEHPAVQRGESRTGRRTW